MPKSINEIHVAGHAGRDAEVKYTPSGTAVANFTIATGGGPRKGGGEYATEWHNIVAWSELAEAASRIKKGVFVDVKRGRIQTRSWDDKKTGEKKYRTEIVAAELEIHDKQTEPHQRPLTPQPVSKPRQYAPMGTNVEIDDSDVPF